MTFQRIGIVLVAAFLLFWGYRQFGWGGVAGVSGALFLWLMLHVTRLMTVMQRAARRPIGYVDSAVMLNAKLRAGQSLFHVVALTRALGERQSAEGEQPEVYRWTDNGGSWVQARFQGGKLADWAMHRPEATPAEPAEGSGADAP
ncbi:MAG: glycerate kinase [Hydrogenophaga sp.]|uniref:glycerate kinase n=1 Tax=Hydrogenophaga sp. TaxID=1904254 RepID=UPI001D37D8D5|nr:glycerate kinase [Hydrogenophaga sp.]MBX3611649.1 glycerate kinase [Hydrogenophaga sp.]